MTDRSPHTSPSPTIDNRCRYVTAAVCGVGALLLYLRTLAPDISYGGDCGELAAASYIIGNSHPTGYPLYLTLGKLFSSIPLGEVGWRYNLFSAVAAAGAVTVAALCAFETGATWHGALVAGVAFATAHTFWSQAVITEVYALNALFVGLLVLWALLWRNRGDHRFLLLLAMTTGLALAHHLSIVFVAAPLCVYAFVARAPTGGRWRWFGAGALLAVAGLMLYVYLPVRAARNPPLNWGDPRTWSAVMAHVTGKLYKSHMFAISVSELPARIRTILLYFTLQFLFVAPLVVWGFIVLLKRHRDCAVALGVVLLINLSLGLQYDVGDVWNLFIPGTLITGVLAGHGADGWIGWAESFFETMRRLGRWGAAGLLSIVLAAQLLTVYPVVDMRGNDRAVRFTRQTVERIAPGAAVFIHSDETLFTLWYLQQCRGEFRAVRAVSVPDVDTVMAEGLADDIAAAANRGGAYLTFWDPRLAARFPLAPAGRAYAVGREPEVEVTPPSAVDEPRMSGAVEGDEVKRKTLLPVTVVVDSPSHWMPVDAGGKVKVDFCAVRSEKDEVEAGRKWRESHPQLTISILDQVDAWTESRLLPAGDGGEAGRYRWQTLLSVPETALPGRYQVFARIAATRERDRLECRLGSVRVVDK